MAVPFDVWTSLGDVPPASVTGETAQGQVFTAIGDQTATQVVNDSPSVGAVVTSIGDLLPSQI